MDYTQIASRLFDTPLMVAPHKLRAILEVLAPRLGLDGADGIQSLPKGGDPFPDPDAIVDRDDDPKDDEPPRTFAVLNGGVAVIPVVGTLVHRGSWIGAMSGLTSYQGIQRQVIEAMEDPSVTRLVFDYDTPGGEVSGVFDLSDLIAEYRGAKPMTAVVNEASYSAGYALASAADRIVIPRTGGVGSVGVIATHVDRSQRDDAEGYRVTHVYAGARKADFSPHRELSDEAIQWLQEHVEQTYSIFVDTVARNRGIRTDAVRAQEAGIFMGRLGADRGLADEVAPATEAIQREVQEAMQQRRTGIMTGKSNSVHSQAGTTLPNQQGGQVPAQSGGAGDTPEVSTQTNQVPGMTGLTQEKLDEMRQVAAAHGMTLTTATSQGQQGQGGEGGGSESDQGGGGQGDDTKPAAAGGDASLAVASLASAARDAGVSLTAEQVAADPQAAVQAIFQAGTNKGTETAKAEAVERAKEIKGLARQANRPSAAMDLFLEGLTSAECRERLFADLASQQRVDAGLTPDAALGGQEQTPTIDTQDIYRKRAKVAQAGNS